MTLRHALLRDQVSVHTRGLRIREQFASRDLRGAFRLIWRASSGDAGEDPYPVERQSRARSKTPLAWSNRRRRVPTTPRPSPVDSRAALLVAESWLRQAEVEDRTKAGTTAAKNDELRGHGIGPAAGEGDEVLHRAAALPFPCQPAGKGSTRSWRSSPPMEPRRGGTCRARGGP